MIQHLARIICSLKFRSEERRSDVEYLSQEIAPATPEPAKAEASLFISTANPDTTPTSTVQQLPNFLNSIYNDAQRNQDINWLSRNWIRLAYNILRELKHKDSDLCPSHNSRLRTFFTTAAFLSRSTSTSTCFLRTTICDSELYPEQHIIYTLHPSKEQ